MFTSSSQLNSTAVLLYKEAHRNTQNGSKVHIGHNPNVVELRGPKLITPVRWYLHRDIFNTAEHIRLKKGAQ